MTKQFSLIPFVFGNLGNDIDIFHRMFDNKLDLPATEASDWSPRLDIKEEENHFIVRADIPGVNPKDINITVEKNILHIHGTKESERHEANRDKSYVLYERVKGSFSRSISLPSAVDAENIDAKSKNGVLEVIIPKLQKSAARKIEVKETA